MTILAIDPGTTESAYVLLHPDGISAFAKVDNETVLALVELHAMSAESGVSLAIEGIASYGMAVGAEVFETCVWTGRFIQAWAHHRGETGRRVFRRDVKLHLCGQTRAKDANVRQALIDRYGPGKEAAIGKKASPGPLYGMKSDVWQALALAVTVQDGAA